MDIKNINIKDINYLVLIKIFYIIAIITMASILIFVALFLYNNVFKTLSQADILTDLKQEVIEKNLEQEKFYQILDNIENKTAEQTTTEKINNPFIPLAQ